MYEIFCAKQYYWGVGYKKKKKTVTPLTEWVSERERVNEGQIKVNRGAMLLKMTWWNQINDLEYGLVHWY